MLIFTGAGLEYGFQLLFVDQEHSARVAEAANIYRFSRLQRLVQLELPYSAIGLVWNSMVSVAGGWFFLMACEMFALGTGISGCRGWVRICRLRRGLEIIQAITWGLLTMIAIIVATDQLIWRPVIAWSDKFKFEQVESATRVRSPLLHLLQHSRGASALARPYGGAAGEGACTRRGSAGKLRRSPRWREASASR